MKTYLAVCLCLISSSLWAGWDAIGPFGGSVAVVQVDRHHRGTVFAATSNAQLFESEDDGAFWRVLPFPAALRATLHAFVIDPQVPGVFLVGLSSDNLEYSGIFRTEDSGLTWRRLTSPGLQEVWSIAICPRDSRVIAAGTLDGVFLTHNGGEIWEHVAAPDDPEPKPVVSIEFDTIDSNTLYAGTPHLPWKTVDGGVTWHSIHRGMLDDSDVFSILIDNRRHDRLFAGACGGIYRSLDGGETWTKLREAKGASERTYQIVQHPLRPSVFLAATAHGLIKSVDGGTTWRGLSTQSTRWIAFDPGQPDRIFVATDAGLFRGDNLGEKLQPLNRGFSNRRLNSLAASGNTLYVSVRDSSGSSLLRRTDPEETWEAVPPAQLVPGEPLKVASVDGEILYVLTDDRLAVASAVYPSWIAIRPPSTNSRLLDLLFATPDSSTLLVNTEDGIYRTDDTGETWNLVHFYASQTYGIVTTKDNDWLSATSRGLMRSEDMGVTWRPVPGALGESTVRAICKHPAQPGLLFAAQYGTIFSSQDDGQSWTPIPEGELAGDAVSALLVVPGSPDRLFALTESRGVYAIPLGSE